MSGFLAYFTEIPVYGLMKFHPKTFSLSSIRKKRDSKRDRRAKPVRIRYRDRMGKRFAKAPPAFCRIMDPRPLQALTMDRATVARPGKTRL